MLNRLKLKAVQVESGISVEEISNKICLNQATVYRKMSGKSEFTASEMIAIKRILYIDFQSFCDIFLAPNLCKRKKATNNNLEIEYERKIEMEKFTVKAQKKKSIWRSRLVR